ncbi:hypothetical protein DUNSADRAFT_17123 [Dunaliella salina]|uniref:SEP domain-containing protein n=1 Tax=Dunaliella salina TaxID=3046 RepID=A0ABQ7G2B6_DUNSA|nr:hypothetical protein DUNSADRAFT_17123 [Dunaliella salina]|eukprot:KAF5828745.1 hypothetical protein DUNSADRAFT_17123 [Dunaliella salina]
MTALIKYPVNTLVQKLKKKSLRHRRTAGRLKQQIEKMAHIKSMDDLRKAESEDDSRDENDYYAGGKSGQIIRGPPDEDDEDEDKVSSLFDKARRSGAVQGTSSDLEQPSSSFRGQGRTLAGGGPQAGAAPQTGGPQVHVITFYRNHVFTVDNGPPRRVDDPANFDFIASISKGECPKELEPSLPGTEISVNLVRKEEDYSEPEKSR